ncbi:MAG: hypothetical protein IPM74_12270 [Crocinitomicaceae bacterium]|nr:hypothetical protein [Crocinitomicaceae bacterium]
MNCLIKIISLSCVWLIMACTQNNQHEPAGVELNPDAVTEENVISDLLDEPPADWPKNFAHVIFENDQLNKCCDLLVYHIKPDKIECVDPLIYDEAKISKQSFNPVRDQLIFYLSDESSMAEVIVFQRDSLIDGLYHGLFYSQDEFQNAGQPFSQILLFDMDHQAYSTLGNNCEDEWSEESFDPTPVSENEVVGITICKGSNSEDEKFSFSVELLKKGKLSGTAFEDVGTSSAKFQSGTWECKSGKLYLTFVMNGSKMSDDGMQDFTYEKELIMDNMETIEIYKNNCSH